MHKHKTSKEIALELGISPYTVDKHVQAACKALGVENRREAAFMLSRKLPPEQLVTEPTGMSLSLPIEPKEALQPDLSPRAAEMSDQVFRQAWDARGYGSNTLRVLRNFGERTRRLILIALFSLLILTFGTLFVTVLNTLTELVRQMM